MATRNRNTTPADNEPNTISAAQHAGPSLVVEPAWIQIVRELLTTMRALVAAVAASKELTAEQRAEAHDLRSRFENLVGSPIGGEGTARETLRRIEGRVRTVVDVLTGTETVTVGENTVTRPTLRNPDASNLMADAIANAESHLETFLAQQEVQYRAEEQRRLGQRMALELALQDSDFAAVYQAWRHLDKRAKLYRAEDVRLSRTQREAFDAELANGVASAELAPARPLRTTFDLERLPALELARRELVLTMRHFSRYLANRPEWFGSGLILFVEAIELGRTSDDYDAHRESSGEPPAAA